MMKQTTSTHSHSHSFSSLHDVLDTVTTELIPSAPTASPTQETRGQITAGKMTAVSPIPRQEPLPVTEASPDYALRIAIDWADKGHDVCAGPNHPTADP